jgi:hypothetical protein
MNGTRGLSAWRWLFIIEGGVTVFIAGFGYFILPNFPRTTSWLTEEERQLAAWRLEEDIGQDDWIDSQHQTFGHGLKLAFTDPKMYILVRAPFLPIYISFLLIFLHFRWSCSSASSRPALLRISFPPSSKLSAITTSFPSSSPHHLTSSASVPRSSMPGMPIVRVSATSTSRSRFGFVLRPSLLPPLRQLLVLGISQ